MITRQRDAQGGRVPAWGVAADEGGQEIEARLVGPDDRAPLSLRPFLSAGQRSANQAAISASLRWLARRRGFWGLHPTARSTRLTCAG
jgi:hypothetical protein